MSDKRRGGFEDAMGVLKGALPPGVSPEQFIKELRGDDTALRAERDNAARFAQKMSRAYLRVEDEYNALREGVGRACRHHAISAVIYDILIDALTESGNEVNDD